jgi:hypothetical protein
MTHRTTMYPGYDVGYGRPPRRARFQKGQSGNPGGRKRGLTEERARRLALKEAYRKLKVQDGEDHHAGATGHHAQRGRARHEGQRAQRRGGYGSRGQTFFQFPAFFPASEGNHRKPPRQSGNVIASEKLGHIPARNTG